MREAGLHAKTDRYGLHHNVLKATEEGALTAPTASEMFFAMTAGSDTTGSAIRNIMLHLMTSPQHYRALKDTVSRAITDGTVSSPITQEQARKLPYLQVSQPSTTIPVPGRPLTTRKINTGRDQRRATHPAPRARFLLQNRAPRGRHPRRRIRPRRHRRRLQPVSADAQARALGRRRGPVPARALARGPRRRRRGTATYRDNGSVGGFGLRLWAVWMCGEAIGVYGAEQGVFRGELVPLVLTCEVGKRRCLLF